MIVIVRLQFESPGEDDWNAVRALAHGLTNRPKSVRVFADDKEPQWLGAEFNMLTQPQDEAVDKIDSAIRFGVWQRQDTTIQFPISEAARARAKRKAERRRARRRGEV